MGWIAPKVDPRKLMTIGFLGFAICSFTFSRVDLGIGPFTLLIPVVITGFALSFVYVPLATEATSTVPIHEIGNATGLFNMLRNIGGSIGIAIAATSIIRRAALHQTDLGGHLAPSDPVLQQKSALAATYIGHHLGTAAGRPGAFGAIYGTLLQQSALLAYVDVFRWTAVLGLICAVCTWLFRNPGKHNIKPPGLH